MEIEKTTRRKSGLALCQITPGIILGSLGERVKGSGDCHFIILWHFVIVNWVIINFVFTGLLPYANWMGIPIFYELSSFPFTSFYIFFLFLKLKIVLMMTLRTCLPLTRWQLRGKKVDEGGKSWKPPQLVSHGQADVWLTILLLLPNGHMWCPSSGHICIEHCVIVNLLKDVGGFLILAMVFSNGPTNRAVSRCSCSSLPLPRSMRKLHCLVVIQNVLSNDY